MKQDRFLLGILIGIGVLIVAALVVFLTGQKQATYVPDDTPDGVVHNYVLAVLNKDYPRAYAYLADLTNKPTYDSFRQSFAVGRLNPGMSGIKLGAAEIAGDSASVDVMMLNASGDPFNAGLNDMGKAQLLMQNGAWKISSLPAYNVWDFGWYQPQPKYAP